MADQLEMEYETIFVVIDSWENLRRIEDYELAAGSVLFTKCVLWFACLLSLPLLEG